MKRIPYFTPAAATPTRHKTRYETGHETEHTSECDTRPETCHDQAGRFGWIGILLSGIVLISACANKPATPNWQANAHAALKDFSAAYLSGNSRVANLEFARARNEIASTGRADLLARAELVRCATRVASLEFDNCAGLATLADDALPAERAYAAFLKGSWQGLDAAALPAQHRLLVISSTESARNAALAGQPDPLAQLIAAGVLFQMGQLSPIGIATAVNTASQQGWRRPLLAWLGVQAQRAETAGDNDAKARILRRIDLVSASGAASP